MVPPGPSASRTASRRASSSPRVWPASATLTLAVVHPPARTIAWARSGLQAGTVTLTGTASRSGAGQSPAAASSAARSHGRAVGASYSVNGLHSPQPGRALDQHALADGDAAEAGAQRDAEDADHAASPARATSACRSTLPLSSSGSASRATTWRGAHERGCASPTQSRTSSSTTAPDHEGHDAVPPLLVLDADHLGGVDRRVLAQPARDRGERHVDPAADDDVVEAAEHVQPTVLVEAAGVGGEVPPVDERARRQLRVVDVALEEGRAADPDPAVGPDRDARRRRAGGRRRRSRRRSRWRRTSRRRAGRRPRRAGAGPGRSGPPPSRIVCRRRSASTSRSSASSRCSWVGTSEVKSGTSRWCGSAASVAAKEPSTTTGSWPATRDRQTTCTPATYDAGSASSHWPPAPRRRADACTEARTACRASSTRLGVPGRPRRLHHERHRLGHHRQPVPQRGDHLGGPTPHRTQGIHETHASPAGRMVGDDLPATRSAGVPGAPTVAVAPDDPDPDWWQQASCRRRRWPAASASSRSCSPSARARSSPAARSSSPRSSGSPPPRWASA